MIPIRLSLEGIYSYQQKQNIDFQYLTSAELFGIFGATGSGKSSILEAIGFAIYDQTERLNKREPGGMAYNMMNLKSDRLAIDFECWAGKGNQTRYRFGVENRRKKKDFGKTDSFKRQTYEWVDNGWMPMDQAPEEIIGLSYENFRRCIIIPQGKFEEFLRLTAGDRTKMLQDLFSLDKYDLRGNVSGLISRNNLQKENTSGKLAIYTEVTNEAIADNQQQIEALSAQLKELETTLSQRQRAYESAQQLQELFERIKEVQARMVTINEQKPAHEARKRQLERYQLAQVTFATTLSEFDRISRSLKETDLSVQQKQESREASEAELAKKETAFTQTEEAWDTRDQFLKKADELEQIIRLKETQEVIDNRRKRVADGKARIEEAEQSSQKLSTKLEELDQQITKLETERPDHSLLMAVKDWFYQQEILEGRLEEKQKSKENIEEKIDQGRKQKITIAGRIGIDISRHDLPVTRLIEQITQQETELIARKKTLEEQRRREEVRQSLRDLSDNLQPGEPCPLCGSTEHSTKRRHHDGGQHLSQLKTDIQEVDRHIDEIRQYLPSLNTLVADARELGTELKEADQAIAGLRERLDKHQSQFVWAEFEDNGRQKVEARMAAATETDNQLKQLRQNRQALQTNLKQVQKRLAQYRPALEQVQQELNVETGAFSSGVKALKTVHFKDYESSDLTTLNREVLDLKIQHESIESLYNTLRREIDERKSRLATLKGEITSLQNRRRDEAADVAKLSQKLDKLLGDSPFESRDEVRQVLAQALDMDAERDEIRRFEREETQAQTTLKDLQEQVNGRKFDLESFQNLEAEIKELTHQSKSLGQKIGAKEEHGKKLQADLAKKQELIGQLEALKQRGENLKILETLFRGNGFVNYISTVYLENLCAAANARFLRLTGNALHLEVDPDNNFLVCDMLNGGRTRSVKTLSGGQTFQAALCLALALSDQVQQQASASQNFFFLDEGFGSQDKRSLRTIFQTLKSLREENRIVGVISHVEELQQEIDTHLRIVNDPEKGSTVVESWG